MNNTAGVYAKMTPTGLVNLFHTAGSSASNAGFLAFGALSYNLVRFVVSLPLDL